MKMQNIHVNFQKHTIELTSKKFANASARFGTDEYNALQAVRRDYPTFKVVTAIRKSAAASFKGLTYEYMEKYIRSHDDEEKTIMSTYLMLRGEDADGDELSADSVSYQAVKDWFLEKYPAIADYHKKREELVEVVQKQKKASHRDIERKKMEARRNALLGIN